MSRYAPHFLILAPLILALNTSCANLRRTQGKEAQFNFSHQRTDEEKLLTREELQEVLFRFESFFSARINDAFHSISLSSPSQKIRFHANRQKLLYTTSALNIATSPLPESGLLDMIVFVRLSQDVFRDYWIPTLYQETGKPLLSALQAASDQLDRIASNYLSENEIAQLKKLVDDWHQMNPGVVSVEFVRLAEFSAEVANREEELARQISGLLSPIKGATVSVEKALLLGERGFYYAQRAPFLLALQARVLLQDSLRDLHTTFGRLASTGLQPQQPGQADPRPGESALSGPIERLRESIRSLLVSLAVVGALLIVFAGVVYTAAKLISDRIISRRIGVRKKARRDGASRSIGPR